MIARKADSWIVTKVPQIRAKFQTGWVIAGIRNKSADFTFYTAIPSPKDSTAVMKIDRIEGIDGGDPSFRFSTLASSSETQTVILKSSMMSIVRDNFGQAFLCITITMTSSGTGGAVGYVTNGFYVYMTEDGTQDFTETEDTAGTKRPCIRRDAMAVTVCETKDGEHFTRYSSSSDDAAVSPSYWLTGCRGDGKTLNVRLPNITEGTHATLDTSSYSYIYGASHMYSRKLTEKSVSYTTKVSGVLQAALSCNASTEIVNYVSDINPYPAFRDTDAETGQDVYYVLIPYKNEAYFEDADNETKLTMIGKDGYAPILRAYLATDSTGTPAYDKFVIPEAVAKVSFYTEYVRHYNLETRTVEPLTKAIWDEVCEDLYNNQAEYLGPEGSVDEEYSDSATWDDYYESVEETTESDEMPEPPLDITEYGAFFEGDGHSAYAYATWQKYSATGCVAESIQGYGGYVYKFRCDLKTADPRALILSAGEDADIEVMSGWKNNFHPLEQYVSEDSSAYAKQLVYSVYYVKNSWWKLGLSAVTTTLAETRQEQDPATVLPKYSVTYPVYNPTYAEQNSNEQYFEEEL